MAELISKVVRSAHRVDDRSSDAANTEANNMRRYTMPQPHTYFPGKFEADGQHRGETAESQVPVSAAENYLGTGIMKTVTTLIGTGTEDDSDTCSRQNSTAHGSVTQ